MRFINLSATIFAISLFSMACNTNRPAETANINSSPNDATLDGVAQGENDVWAKENLDLGRVGSLLERANNAEEFENLLNSDDGINNLDLNGDGYVDYISVAEFDDRDDNGRGLSLFSRFGPDVIQEIATLFFNRDNRNSRGARILLTGNDQIYGDNNYYETNWLDRNVGIADFLFSDRDTYYRSPYYYGNYPESYQTYRVVDVPVYRTRVERIYPTPVFFLTGNPTITKIKIKSPFDGKSMNKIFSKLAKPTKEQKEFMASNPRRPEFVLIKNESRKNDLSKPDDRLKGERKIERENGKPSDSGKGEKKDAKPSDPRKGGNDKDKGKGKGKGKDN